MEALHTPNLASEVLRAALRRLSADLEPLWGRPVDIVDIFTDPARQLCTGYKDANSAQLDTDSRYSRRTGCFVHYGWKATIA